LKSANNINGSNIYLNKNKTKFSRVFNHECSELVAAEGNTVELTAIYYKTHPDIIRII